MRALIGLIVQGNHAQPSTQRARQSWDDDETTLKKKEPMNVFGAIS